MDFAAIIDGVESFAAYVGELASVIGHVGRVAPLHDYCAGLLASEGRRSVEPMAALTAPAEVSVQHQRLLHFVGEADWSDARVLMKVRQLVVPVIEEGEPIKAWIIDDTSYPKQGNHSVGVHHQYCGQLGKQANCQAAVTLSIANHRASLPIAHQLYLPKAWATDAARRRKAHVPKTVRFMTKPQIALMQITAALKAGVAPGVVLMDASYGTNAGLRFGIAVLGLTYAGAIVPTVKVCAVAEPQERVSVKTLALRLPKHAWRTITWREGSAEKLTSRFARVRVRTAPSKGARELGAAGHPEETLLIEWPPGEAAPTKYWLSNLPAKTKFRDLVDINALAHRARLSGAQTGDRTRPLRGPRMARLSSSRHTVHRGLRLPDLPTGEDSPLSTTCRRCARETCPSRRLPTPRRRRSGRSATSPTQSPPCIIC